MELVPMGPGFGVEVKGVGILDVASDGDAYQAVREAFEEHSLLLFRNQPVADDIQVGFSRAFGPLELTKVASLGAGSFYSRLTNVGLNGELVPVTLSGTVYRDRNNDGIINAPLETGVGGVTITLSGVDDLGNRDRIGLPCQPVASFGTSLGLQQPCPHQPRFPNARGLNIRCTHYSITQVTSSLWMRRSRTRIKLAWR